MEKGPYLLAALICREVILDEIVEDPSGQADGRGYTPTAIFNVAGLERPRDEKPGQRVGMTATLFLHFATAGKVGTMPLRIVQIAPSKAIVSDDPAHIEFVAGQPTASVPLRRHIDIDESGTYLFEVYLAGRFIVRVPLLVKHFRAPMPS